MSRQIQKWKSIRCPAASIKASEVSILSEARGFPLAFFVLTFEPTLDIKKKGSAARSFKKRQQESGQEERCLNSFLQATFDSLFRAKSAKCQRAENFEEQGETMRKKQDERDRESLTRRGFRHLIGSRCCKFQFVWRHSHERSALSA